MRNAIGILKKAEDALEWQIGTVAVSCEDDEKLNRDLDDVRQAICELESAMARGDMRREAGDEN